MFMWVSVSCRCQRDISISSIPNQTLLHIPSMRRGWRRQRQRGRVVLLGSLLWHCECQTPITLIRARICMIKRIRDFNQKNSLVWKRDTLRQARLTPPRTLPAPPTPPHLPPTPSVTATAAPVWAPHEYAWARQEMGTTLKWTGVCSAEEELKASTHAHMHTHVHTLIDCEYNASSSKHSETEKVLVPSSALIWAPAAAPPLLPLYPVFMVFMFSVSRRRFFTLRCCLKINYTCWNWHAYACLDIISYIQMSATWACTDTLWWCTAEQFDGCVSIKVQQEKTRDSFPQQRYKLWWLPKHHRSFHLTFWMNSLNTSENHLLSFVWLPQLKHFISESDKSIEFIWFICRYVHVLD